MKNEIIKIFLTGNKIEALIEALAKEITDSRALEAVKDVVLELEKAVAQTREWDRYVAEELRQNCVQFRDLARDLELAAARTQFLAEHLKKDFAVVRERFSSREILNAEDDQQL